MSQPTSSPAPSNRVPGADLLRIVTMLMILTSHFFVHGGVLGRLKPGEPYFYICWIIEACCYVMVNCYALITGYFQSRTDFKLKKLLLLWGQIVCISGGLYLILCLTGQVRFGWLAFLQAAFPITQKRYWFATAYVILYTLSPLFNFAIRRMNRRQHALCLAVLCGVFVVFRNFSYWIDFAALGGGYSWASLSVLYMIGAYLRLYPPKFRFPLLWYFGLSLITAASRIILTTLYYKYNFDSSFLKMFMQYNSVPVVAASVLLFVFFVNLNIRNRVMLWIIKFFSPAAFGVYLIHEQIEVKNIIWKLIEPAQFIKSPKLLPYLLLVIFALFLICALIDKIRHLLSVLLHVPQAFGFVSDKISAIFKKAFNKLVPDEGETS